jgi:hypothetical protein
MVGCPGVAARAEACGGAGGASGGGRDGGGRVRAVGGGSAAARGCAALARMAGAASSRRGRGRGQGRGRGRASYLALTGRHSHRRRVRWHLDITVAGGESRVGDPSAELWLRRGRGPGATVLAFPTTYENYGLWGWRLADTGAVWAGEQPCCARARAGAGARAGKRFSEHAFTRSVLTENPLCQACSCSEIEDGNRPGQEPRPKLPTSSQHQVRKCRKPPRPSDPRPKRDRRK